MDAVEIAEKMIGADNVSEDLANELREVSDLVQRYNGHPHYKFRSPQTIAMIIVNHRKRIKT